jgi:hypothetical protein
LPVVAAEWGMGRLEDKELLWCLLCNGKFSLSDIEKGTYISITGICRECYGKMWKSEQTCFGKEEFYDKETLECSTFCPDRKVCAEFVKVSIPKG